MEWVRRCYIGKWRLFKGRPDIITAGRYYRAPEGMPDFPGWHHYGSRDWDDTEQGDEPLDLPLGELRGVPREWDSGVEPPRIPTPSQLDLQCFEEGERVIPRNSAHFWFKNAVPPVLVQGDGFPTRVIIPNLAQIFGIAFPVARFVPPVDVPVAIGKPELEIDMAFEVLAEIRTIGKPELEEDHTLDVTADVRAIGLPEADIDTGLDVLAEVPVIGLPEADIDTGLDMLAEVPVIGLPEADIDTSLAIVAEVPVIGLPEAELEVNEPGGEFPMQAMTNVYPDTDLGDPSDGKVSWEFLGDTMILAAIDGVAHDWSEELAALDDTWTLRVRTLHLGGDAYYAIVDIVDNEDGTFTLTLELTLDDGATNHPALELIFSPPA